MTTILMLGASPPGTQNARLEEERAGIERAIRGAQYGAEFELRHAFAFSPRDLGKELLTHRPAIIHFSGHGTPRGELVTHGEDRGEIAHLGPAALAGVLELFSADIRCLFLNACFTTAQIGVLARSIDFVIGTHAKLSAASAIDAAQSFYRGIASGTTLAAAFALAEKTPALRDLPEPHLRLCVREGVDATGFTFAPALAPPPPPPPPPSPLITQLAALLTEFFTADGLRVELQRLGIHAQLPANLAHVTLALTAAELMVNGRHIDRRWFDGHIARARGRRRQAFTVVRDSWIRHAL